MMESRNSITNSTSQARLSIEPKINSVQQSTSSITVNDQQLSLPFVVPEHKETSEAATDTPRWSPEPNLMVEFWSSYFEIFHSSYLCNLILFINEGSRRL